MIKAMSENIIQPVKGTRDFLRMLTTTQKNVIIHFIKPPALVY